MILKIRTYGDPVLRQKAEPIKEINEEIKKLAQDMIESMYQENGVGLAAPQVGISKRMIAIDAGEERGHPFVLINPELIGTEGKATAEEGCLSFPGIYGNIQRAASLKVKGIDAEGKEKSLSFTGLECRAILHEIDHLDGILFIDKMSASHKLVIKSKLKKLKKQTLDEMKNEHS
ncbi:MAG: hypothetical protein ACD_79C01255G0005 [uncultured bacterium]|nr:MAG: hypothetical protein ACD_79C01255G0005 [uncultured bacterium]